MEGAGYDEASGPSSMPLLELPQVAVWLGGKPCTWSQADFQVQTSSPLPLRRDEVGHLFEPFLYLQHGDNSVCPRGYTVVAM